jgi:hypothetical protein
MARRRRTHALPPECLERLELLGSKPYTLVNEVDAGRRRRFYSWRGREGVRESETEYAPQMYDFFSLRVFHYSSTHLDGLQYMRA